MVERVDSCKRLSRAEGKFVLLQRVVTAIILLALAIPAVFVAPVWVWGVFSLLFLSAGAWEWGRLLNRQASPLPLALTVTLLGSLILVLRELGWAHLTALAPLVALAAVFWIGAAGGRLHRHQSHGGGWPLAAVLLLGCWMALYELRRLGPEVLITAMAIVWLADIGAYFAGKAFGRRRLAPTISPGKSWEGAIAGALLVIVAGPFAALHDTLAAALPARMYEQWGPFAASMILGLLVALSIVGDLYESLLKRQAGVKDSGWVLPGHGGVLDRIDALLPTMPVMLLLHLMLR